MKKNVLVFPCGSEIGLEIYRSLYASTHVELYGASSVSDHGSYVYERYVDGVPFVDDPEFIPALNKIIDEQKIDFIFPAHDSVVLKLAQAKGNGSLHCEVVTSPLATCEVVRSKKATYAALHDVVSTPRVYDDINAVGSSDLPVFLKPDVGQGSKGTQKARTIEDIAFYTQKDSTLLIVEYLPGKEYTVDCFTDRHGELRFCAGRERKRISSGISVSSARVDDERFRTLARRINDMLQFNGAWFFQVKERQNRDLVLMEVATRIAGTMGLERCMGANLALLSVFNAMGMDVDIFENNYQLTIDRALENSYKHSIVYDHVYLDFDDLVILNGKVNVNVMAFVYQCINKGIKVHLLTKHKDDLTETLQKYRLQNTFDEVIWIQDEREKSIHIIEKNAIFIDDSFAERKQIWEQHRIPVFDAHMIESLMEE